MRISGTLAPSGSGAASLAQPRRSTSAPTRWSSAIQLWAEMTCFLQLGWRFPGARLRSAHRLSGDQQHPAAVRPGRDPQEAAQALADACRAYGIEGWENIDKPEMAKAIGEGRWREYGREACCNYCEEDVRNSAELLRRQLTGLPQLCARRSRSASCTGATTAPRPSPGFRRAACRSTCRCGIWCRRTRRAVIGALIARFDPSQGSEYPIYSPDGEWSSWRFAHWLVERPASPNGRGWIPARSQLDGDAFRMMYGAHPAIEGLHALRDGLGVIVRARIPIGRDGRNRPSLFPFGTATGRNAQAKSLFNAHASMRSFMKFPTRQDRALSGLANAGSRHCGGAQRGCGAGGGLSLAATSITRSRMLCGLTNDTTSSAGRHD